MNPKLEETIVLDFITSSATGAAVDADSLPTAAVYEDTTDVSILSPTIAKRTSLTGNYRASIACTAANGFEAGKSYNVIVSATIGGIAAKAKIGSFQMRTRSIDDASTYAGGAVASVTAGVTVTTNSDKTGYSLTVTPPTAAAIATAIWTDTTAGDFTTATSPGKIIFTQLGGAFTTTSSSVFTTAALANGSAGDPWGTAIPASYTTGQAGNLIGNALAAINSKAFNKVIEYIAGATCGTLSEPTDRSTTTIKGINSGSTIITSVNSNDGTTAARTVTLH